MPQTIAIITRAVLVLLVTALLPAACGLNGPAAAAEESRSAYDLEEIYQRPLEVETTETKVLEGIRIEHLRFSTWDADGQKFRVKGIIAFPDSEGRVPGLLWSNSSMAAANTRYPLLFAKRGLACLNITLPQTGKAKTTAFASRTLERHPLRFLIRVELRAFELLSRRPEIDPTRLGVAGASWGGYFASMLAGIEPRVRAGMSFFCGGHWDLGRSGIAWADSTEATQAGVRRLFDPAPLLRRRCPPFMWGIAAVDHHIQFPALWKTLEDAAHQTANRWAIAPEYDHGLPPVIDETLFGWFDHHLLGRSPAYNRIVSLAIEERDGTDLRARLEWTGDHRIAEAELVLSPGDLRPWAGWPVREHHAIPMRVGKTSAEQIFRIPDAQLPYVVYGTIRTAAGITVSSMPRRIDPDERGWVSGTPIRAWNLSRVSDFEDEERHHIWRLLRRHQLDEEVAHDGKRSLRLKGEVAVARIPLNLVLQRRHRLSLWMKTDGTSEVDLTVQARMSGANRPLRLFDWSEEELQKAKDGKLILGRKTTALKQQWQKITLELPAVYLPLTRVTLSIRARQPGKSSTWLDTVQLSFLPAAQPAGT